MEASRPPRAVLVSVGPRLREVRKQRGLTLQEIAERTGISVSTLSRLESGLRRPSLELLLPLARAYRVPIDELVGAPATGDPRIFPKAVQREGRVWIPLTRDRAGPNVFKQVLPVNEDLDARPALRVHDGHEWLYVIHGTLRLTLGSEDFVLTAGQAAEFDTRLPHAFTNAGGELLEVLHIFGPHGERIHTRSDSAETGRP